MNDSEETNISEKLYFELVTRELKELNNISSILDEFNNSSVIQNKNNIEKLKIINELESRFNDSFQKANSFLEQICKYINKKIVTQTEKII